LVTIYVKALAAFQALPQDINHPTSYFQVAGIYIKQLSYNMANEENPDSPHFNKMDLILLLAPLERPHQLNNIPHQRASVAKFALAMGI
jgi:hypothetical protein